LKVYQSIFEFFPVKNPVVTIGTYDGVHIGHQKIIARLKELASEIRGEVVLLTFHPHPRMVLFPEDHGLLLLNSLDEKIRLLEEFGIDHIIIHPFTKEFSRTSSTEFVRDILVNKIGMKKLVIGYDHHFGRNREGSYQELLELASVFNYEVEKIPEQDVHHIAVSSTKIRKALLEGDLHTASGFLGYNYSLTGTVVKGNQLGRKLGFPTANLELKEKFKLIPAKGIYAVKVFSNDEEYKGMLSIGHRPTIEVNGAMTIEVNLFDFNNDLYGKNITVEFLNRLRDEIKFDSLEDLVKQMEKDKSEAMKVLK
jgi:riboflavin kinase/FMN adenylyltransferase